LRVTDLHRFIYRQPQEQFRDDVERSLDLLSELAGKPVRGYRAPFFSITKSSLWALPILRGLGIRYDSSIHPVLNHRYGIQDAP
jgi:peptidoglycan/xylan/chitin deacetylase (PgdA/CDA1 family)